MLLFDLGNYVSVFVKLHFAKLIASCAKYPCNISAGCICARKLGIEHGLINYVCVVAFTIVAHENREIYSALLANVCKQKKSLVESLKLRKISLRRILGEYYYIFPRLYCLYALANGFYYIYVAVPLRPGSV